MTHTQYLRLAGLMAASLLFSGCEATDPYKREGMWRPEGVVNANLAAQIANPQDMLRGRGDTGPVYRTATNAVNKQWGLAPGASAGGGGGGAAPPPPTQGLNLPGLGGGDPGGAPK